MKGLTKRQQAFLQFIYDFICLLEYPPTIADIGREFKLRCSNAIHKHLVALEKKGMIEREPHKARAIKITDKGLENVQSDKRKAA